MKTGNCVVCGAGIEQRQGRGRPRRYCAACKDARRLVVAERPAAASVPSPADQAAPGTEAAEKRA